MRRVKRKTIDQAVTLGKPTKLFVVMKRNVVGIVLRQISRPTAETNRCRPFCCSIFGLRQHRCNFVFRARQRQRRQLKFLVCSHSRVLYRRSHICRNFRSSLFIAAKRRARKIYRREHRDCERKHAAAAPGRSGLIRC